MTLSVSERAKIVATFRFIEVRLMEITAAWTPITPEMEVKVMFGRHIWDFAQHADLLGKRTFELRQPEHYTLKPADSYAALIEEMASQTTTAARLAALYDEFLPALADRYRGYLSAVDTLLDYPTVVIVERILADIERMQSGAAEVRRTMKITSPAMDQFGARERAVAQFTA
jgi:hypothetical protein